MKVEILGSGGALSTPKPLCRCGVCVEARQKGVPYSRTGPATFVHGPDVLIDTPEEIKQQLNRSTVTKIAACFYSHWHPDHVMGCRVWDMNGDFRSWPRRTLGSTTIYLPQQVAADFRVRLGFWEHLSFLAERGWVELVELVDGDSVTLGRTTIHPFRVAVDCVYAFVFEADAKRLLVAPDELNGWSPPADLGALDLAVIPMGIAEFDPWSGERRIHPEHPVLSFEATFQETLAIVERLDARRVVLTHIEEMDGLSYDDLMRLERTLDNRITFAYDTMLVEV
jgi:phosphoribosyl 1,2-cyclic phosphate phosphodiesterase